MSQNGTTPTTDENRTTSTISAPLFVPMMPMYIPYTNGNTAGQAFYAPGVYPNLSAYPSADNHRHGNFGFGYNTFYAPFYHTPNNILPSRTHVNSSSASFPLRPLMPPILQSPLPPPPSLQPASQQQQQKSSVWPSFVPNDVERNKNLNIRECQSPIITQPKREKKPLQIVELNDNNTDLKMHTDSSSTSSLISHPESDQIPPSSLAQDIDPDNSQDDFLTFIEQKTKTTRIAMPELNPFANEFSFANNKTLTQDSSITTNGIDHTSNNEKNSSYRLLFDNLIEKSLESIEAIKKSSKKVSVNDISVQCNQINDQMNRSTQTMDQKSNFDLIEEYSLRTIKLMDKLLENFRNLYQPDLHNELTTMAYTCDELRQFIFFINHIMSSLSDNEQRKKSSIDLDNPFSNMIKDLSKNVSTINRYETSSHNTLGVGRGSRRLMSSTSNSPIASFSCRQIDPITTVRSKLCLLCQRPVDDGDDVMHKLCRSLSSQPNSSSKT